MGDCEPSTLAIKTSNKRLERRDAINHKATIVLKTTSKAIIQKHDDWYLFLHSIPPFPVDSWKYTWIIKAEWIVSDHPRSSFSPSSPLVGAGECWQEVWWQKIGSYLSIALEILFIGILFTLYQSFAWQIFASLGLFTFARTACLLQLWIKTSDLDYTVWATYVNINWW